MNRKSYECPCCGQEFTPEQNLSPEEYLAKGCIQLFAEKQKELFEQGFKSCPRCGNKHMEAELKDNVLSMQYKFGDVYVCPGCGVDKKSKPLYEWEIVNQFLSEMIEEPCSRYIPEQDNPYPLCDNQKCALTFVCQMSAHLSNDGGSEY